MTQEVTGRFTTADIKLPRRLKKSLKKQALYRLWLAPKKYRGKHIRLELVSWHTYFQCWVLNSYSLV